MRCWLIILGLSCFLFACDNKNEPAIFTYVENSEEVLDIDDPVLAEKWREENIPTKSLDLVNFSFRLSDNDEYTLHEDVLDHRKVNDRKIKHTPFEIEEFSDSVVISFWESKVLYGCVFEGDIEVIDDGLKLLNGSFCSPYELITDGEIVLMRLRYTIKPSAYRDHIVSEKIIIKN